MSERLKRKLEHYFAPSDDPEKMKTRITGFRVIAVITMALALNYIIWRYARSLNMNALWFALPMVIAETYGIIESFLFIYMVWNPIKRVPPPPPDDADVDVFIVTYNEPVELVGMTVEAASKIRWQSKKVYLLDDGDRPEMKKLAEDNDCYYITRGEEWAKKPRHAKAGNINNALLQTSGEFILVLDADQIPSPSIIERIIGYFNDPEISFVQTPQYFYNIPPGDPFGNDAPLFYGPIQQGKDGHNASFFCGSNAILRREALVQLGLTGFVQEMEKQVEEGIQRLKKDSKNIKTGNPKITKEARYILKNGLREAELLLKNNEPLERVSDRVRKSIHDAEKIVTIDNIDEISAMLKSMAEAGDSNAAAAYNHIRIDEEEIAEHAGLDTIGTSIGIDPEDVEALNLTRAEEAIPIQSLSTISVTEDMATAMKLHALGWKSVFHSEILAYGLAPEDLESALKQRLRWAQGTIQVFLKENPLQEKGLSISQRLMYFSTMYSYFSGFFNLVLLCAPAVYLLTAVPPVTTWSWEFLLRIIPFLFMNKVLFRYLSWGISVWRGEQYNISLFPLFIRATITAIGKKEIPFVVTPKKKRSKGRGKFIIVWPQLTVIIITVVSIVYATVTYWLGSDITLFGLVINSFWGIYNIVMLSAIIRAARYKMPEGWAPKPPESIFPRS